MARIEGFFFTLQLQETDLGGQSGYAAVLFDPYK